VNKDKYSFIEIFMGILERKMYLCMDEHQVVSKTIDLNKEYFQKC